MNKVILIGRLTRDPELRYTGNNTPVATFSLAVNRPFTNQNGEREVDFINCIVWRKLAETVKNYLSQGSQVAVEGRIQTRRYQNNKGENKYITEILVENIEFLESKSKKEESGVTKPVETMSIPERETNNCQEEFEYTDEEGLPF